MSRFFRSGGSRQDRLPVLLTALGVGVILITSGVAVRVRQDRGVEIALAATMTAAVPDTATPTITNTPLPTETPTATLTPTLTPTGTLPPTHTPTATYTPSPTPVPARPVDLNSVTAEAENGEEGSGEGEGEGEESTQVAPVLPIPPQVEPADIPSGVTNVLLMGSDKRENDPGFRTDVMILVSVNQKENTVNMLSLPRDLIVYIPGWEMNKLNTAYQRGQVVGHEGGGFGMIQDTLMYNFGIRVDHYALVDLSGFQDIVDVLGGVEVPVDCAIEGWVLNEPRLRRDDFPDYQGWVDYTGNDDNWQRYVLPVGVHELDGYMALWYSRYRLGTSDFDRSIRQQQVLRAMLQKGRDDGLINATRIPEYWREYSDLVQTDMGLGNMLQFGPVAANVDNIQITSYFITDLIHYWNGDPAGELQGFIPTEDLRDVLLQRISRAMQPPAQNYIISNSATVEVRNGTGIERLDEIAADRLAWEGLAATATGYAPESPGFQETIIYDFTGRSKTSQLTTMQRTLRVNNDNVIVQPDPNRLFDYVVILGQNYSTCTRNVPDVVQSAATPVATATSTDN